MKLKIGFSIILFAFFLVFAFPKVSSAATFSVSTDAELIAAITSANSNNQADVITLNNNIVLTAAIDNFSGNIGLPSIQPDSSAFFGITINGNGFTISRAAGSPDEFRFFGISTGATLVLQMLQLENGLLSANEGGAIYNQGLLMLDRVTVRNNQAAFGGGIQNNGSAYIFDSTIDENLATNFGGGIQNFGSMSIANSNISDNESGGGGGIFNNSSLVIQKTLFAINYSFGDGGAINNTGNMQIANSRFNENEGFNGGAIYSSGSLVFVGNSLDGNTGASGGGIYSAGPLDVENSTFHDNGVSGDGGGIYVAGGSLNMESTTIANSIGGGLYAIIMVDMRNTIIAYSDDADCFAVLNVNTNNLIEDGSCSPLLAGDPMLDVIFNNGGPTDTRALLVGSPAIDTADTVFCANTDQRGFERPIDGDGDSSAACDIGAFEFASVGDFPSVEFASATATYSETAGTVLVTLNISPVTNFYGTATVYIRDRSVGTAEAGNDYQTFAVTPVTFSCSGTCSPIEQIPLTINTDALFEADETLELEIYASNGFAGIGTVDRQTITIQQEPDVVALTSVDASAGEFGPDHAQLRVEMNFPNTTGAAITIGYSIAGAATNGLDYSTLSGTVDIPVGQASALIDITVLDDAIVENFENVELALTSSSSSAHLVDSTPLSVTINDDDVPGVLINPTAISAVEGGTATYEISLMSQPLPGETVTVLITDGTPGEIASISANPSFNDSNWNIPQTVTVTLNDDLIVNGNRFYSVGITHITSSTVVGGSYDGFGLISDVDVTVVDNESPNVVINPTAFGLRTGDSRIYDVSLSSEPSANVTINLSQLDANCTISPNSLTFTDSLGANPWNVPQQITVTAVGAIGATCTIEHTPSGGGYTGVVASDVVVTIRRDALVAAPSTGAEPEIGVFDPAISKLGLLFPGQTGIVGEELEWVVTVSNIGTVVGTNVTVTDTLISALQIDSVDAPGATVTISGQTVTVVYPSLAVGQTVNFSIFTTVLSGVSIDNTACVMASNQAAQECAVALPISQLPSTGETPFWRYGLLAGIGVVIVSMGMIKLKKKRA